jgi:hypothetical protein
MTEQNNVYKEALDAWGHDPQMDMAIEEMSELIKAILKYRRNPSEEKAFDVSEEWADVMIMMNQVDIAMTRKHPDFKYWAQGNMESKIRNVKKMLKEDEKYQQLLQSQQ